MNQNRKLITENKPGMIKNGQNRGASFEAPLVSLWIRVVGKLYNKKS